MKQRLSSTYIFICLLSFLVYLLAVSCSYAQISGNKTLKIQTIVPSSINVCGDSVPFTIVLTNTGTTSMTNLVIKTTMPEGLLLDESVAVTGGILQGFTGNKKNEPVFTVDNLSASATVNIVYKARANCNIISVVRLTNPELNSDSVKNFTRVDYKANEVNYYDTEENGSSSYNIFISDLDVFIEPQYSSIRANVGDLKERKVRVRNSGLGTLSSVRLRIVYPATPILGQEIIKIGTTTLIPTSNPQPNIYEYRITDFSTAINSGASNGNPLLFEPDEEFVITEAVRVLACASVIMSEFTVEWGCYMDVCNKNRTNASFAAYISNPDGVGDITSTYTLIEGTDFCGTNSGEIQVVHVNTATGGFPLANRATNLVYVFYYDLHDEVLTNEKLYLYVRDTVNPNIGTFKSFSSLGLSVYYASGAYPPWRIYLDNNPATYNIDIDGPGGLEDLDRDGYYDDLAVGDSVIVRMKVGMVCDDNPSNCTGLSHRFGAYLHYDNGCYKNNKYTAVELTEFVIADNDSYIDGPVDMVEGQTETFTLYSRVIFHQHNPGFSTCDINDPNNFKSTVTLPPGYSLVPGTLKWINHAWTPSNPNINPMVEGVHYTIDGQILNILVGGRWGDLVMDLHLDCDGQAYPGLSHSLSWTMDYQCSASCTTCNKRVLCRSLEIYNHCIGSCVGYSTTSFNVQRTSMGWVRNVTPQYPSQVISVADWETLSKVTPATPGIDLHMAMDYDTIQAVATGVLISGTYTYSHLSITYITPVGAIEAPFNVLEFLNGTVYVQGSPCGISLSAPDITMDGRLVTFNFKFLTAICGIVATNTVDYHINFRMKKIPDVYEENYRSAMSLNRFRAMHKGSNDGVHETAYGCQSFGDVMRICSFYSKATEEINQLTCTGIVRNGRVHISGGANQDNFPNEFRPVISLRKVSYPVDPVLNYVEGSAVSTHHYVCCSIIQEHSTIDPDIDEHTVSWDFTKPSTSGLRYVAAATYYVPSISGKFVRRCSMPVLPSVYTASVEYDKYIYTQDPSSIEIKTIAYTHLVQDVSKANLTLVPEAIQEGYQSTVKWRIVVSNPYTPERNSHAEKTWVSIEPTVPGITITGATLNDQPVTVRPYGNANYVMLELGNIILNTLHELIVIAKYSNCIENHVDTINVRASWVCHGQSYPATPFEANCLNTVVNTQLMLRYKNTDLGVEASRISDLGEINLCTPLTHQAIIKSTGYADLEQVKFKVELSKGINYIPGSATYTYNGITGSLANPSSYAYWFNGFTPSAATEQGTTLLWNLSAIAPLDNPSNISLEEGIGSGQLPGNRLPDKSILIVSFQTEAGCGVDAGDALVRMTASAMTNCNDNRVIAPYNDKILIRGLSPLDSMAIDILCTSFKPDKLADITTEVINLGDVVLGEVLPGVKRYLAIAMPIGIVYEPGTSDKGEPVWHAVVSGQNVYRWELPPLYTEEPGSRFRMAFQIRDYNYDYNTRGSVIAITASTQMVASDVFCASESKNCEMTATTAKDVCYMRVITDPPPCPICIAPFAPQEGMEYVISAWVQESTHKLEAASYTNASISLFFGGANVTLGPFYPKGAIIDGWQRIEEVFMVPSNVSTVEIRLNNTTASNAFGYPVYFDDLRIHPFNSNMKSFVYDPYTLRLAAELDENNYATFYEYDQEGGLIRVKKETERGVMTIQESRSNNVKK
jgi:uncharacterized repeat protein (TIGR01451 family)